MNFRTDDNYEEERKKILERRAAAEEVRKRKKLAEHNKKTKNNSGNIGRVPDNKAKNRNSSDNNDNNSSGKNKKKKRLIIISVIISILLVLGITIAYLYVFHFSGKGNGSNNASNSGEGIKINIGQESTTAQSQVGTAAEANRNATVQEQGDVAAQAQDNTITQLQEDTGTQVSSGDASNKDPEETYTNVDGSNWMELSDKYIDNMTSDQVKFMSLEVNLLSKIERIERQNGFLQGINPHSGESFADYVNRVKEFKDEPDIRGFYCNMYYGRNDLASWTLNYCKLHFANDFPYVEEYSDFSQFLLEYVKQYYKYEKNNLHENDELNNEVRKYLKSISKDENSFYVLPFKNTFVNHKEDYIQYVPEYVPAENVRGGDKGKGSVMFFYENTTYEFAQDKNTGDVYYYARNYDGNNNGNIKDKINFSNRWEKTNFIYVIEVVKSSDIDIDKMIEKGYVWVDYNSKEHKNIKNALIKEDILLNKKHVILVEPVDKG